MIVKSANGELDGLTVTAGKDITDATADAITAEGTWIVGGEYTAENGNVVLTATVGSVVGTIAVAKNGESNVIVNADNGELDDTTVAAIGDIIITAKGITAGAYISEEGDIELTATGEDISGVYAKAKLGHVEITTENEFDIIDTTADAYKYAAITSTGNATGVKAISATEDATITAAYGVIDATAVGYVNATVTAAYVDGLNMTALTGDATATAASLNNVSMLTATGAVIAEATNGSITNAEIYAATTATLTATEEIDGTTVTAVDTVDATADTIAASAFVSENADVNATATTAIIATDLIAKAGNVTAEAATITPTSTA